MKLSVDEQFNEVFKTFGYDNIELKNIKLKII